MKISAILVFCLPFIILGQQNLLYHKTINNDSIEGVSLKQSVLIDTNEIVHWYNSSIYNFGKVYFGTTDLQSVPINTFSFKKGNDKFEIAKGAKVSNHTFLTILNNFTPPTAFQSYLVCHNKSGTIHWQKSLDGNVASPNIQATDMSLLGDSIIGIVSNPQNGYVSTIHILDTNGNTLLSKLFTNFKATLIEPFNGDSFWISGYADFNGNQISKIIILKKTGEVVKEYSLPQTDIQTSYGKNDTLTFYSNVYPFNLSQIDTNGIVFSRYVQNLINGKCFEDLVPIRNFYFLSSSESFGSGCFMGMNEDSTVYFNDYARSKFVLPVNDTCTLLFSEGPLYTIKSTYSFPHVGVRLIDSLFNLDQTQFCYIHNSVFQNASNLLNIHETNEIQSTLGTTTQISNIVSVPGSFHSIDSCLLALGLNELTQEIYLYPNPASTELTLESKELLIDHITITSLDGIELISTEIIETNPVIVIRNLKPGYYFISGSIKNGLKFSNRFIKN